MQLDLPFSTAVSEPPPLHSPLDNRTVFVRVRNARRYLLRVRPDGVLRVTIPRWGTKLEALAFMTRHLAWIEAERERVARESPARWTDGTHILYEGVWHRIVVIDDTDPPAALYGNRITRVTDVRNVRPDIEAELKLLAREMLVPRLHELAQVHGVVVKRVSIRSQRSRWGSCSGRGTIALNFRLIQMPPYVRDYVMIHELMHLKELNHSPRFWSLLGEACPDYRKAEQWLRRSGPRLF